MSHTSFCQIWAVLTNDKSFRQVVFIKIEFNGYENLLYDFNLTIPRGSNIEIYRLLIADIKDKDVMARSITQRSHTNKV